MIPPSPQREEEAAGVGSLSQSYDPDEGSSPRRILYVICPGGAREEESWALLFEGGDSGHILAG